MAAHLHAVPDPEPDEAPGSGKWPVPVVVAPQPPADDEIVVDARQIEDAPADEAEDADEDQEAGEKGEEEPRGLLADLKPYYDVRQLPVSELGALAVEVGKTTGPPLIRGIGRVLRVTGRFLHELVQMAIWYGRGIGVLLVLIAGWLSGKYGKRGSLGARCAGAAFLIYAVVRLSQKYQNAWLLIVIALVVTVALAASGHIEIPVSKPAKSGDEKKKAAKGGGAKKGDSTKKSGAAKDEEEGPEETPEASKEPAPDAPRKGLLARLRNRPAAPAKESPEEADDEAPEEDPEGDAEEGPAEGSEEGSEEAPAPPSREDVIRALHHLYRGGSGVLHTALAQHLQLPHTRAVKEALAEAGITHRPGVRTPAGNGPGVHHSDFPPLSSSQGVDVVAGQPANANANNAESGPREGLCVEGNVWTSVELAQGYRWVQDESKPCAWKIEQHEKH